MVERVPVLESGFEDEKERVHTYGAESRPVFARRTGPAEASVLSLGAMFMRSRREAMVVAEERSRC